MFQALSESIETHNNTQVFSSFHLLYESQSPDLIRQIFSTLEASLGTVLHTAISLGYLILRSSMLGESILNKNIFKLFQKVSICPRIDVMDIIL